MSNIVFHKQSMENENTKQNEKEAMAPKTIENSNTPKMIGTDYSYKHVWVWKNVIAFSILHILGIIGFFLVFTGQVGLKTFLWILSNHQICILAWPKMTYIEYQPQPVNNQASRYKDIVLKTEENKDVPKIIGTDYSYKHEWVWRNAIGFLILHILGIVGLLLCVIGHVGLKTFLWAMFMAYFTSEGITMGAHRLYTHKSFKAKPALRCALILMQTIAGQNSVFTWTRDHRLHHRYSDTDGDPHNSKRGFFFSHMGWLMMKKHPYVIKLGKKIDMSDLEADWMVMFQKKYYFHLYVLLAIVFPVMVPIYFFDEPWWKSVLVAYFFRYIYQLNGTWLVNSAAHLYGTRPYDKNLQPVESWFVSFWSLGEGWHNYHHTFPWDYKAAEFSKLFNITATIIEFFEWTGLAYDLKTASPEVVKNRIVRTGDGSHYLLGNEEAKSAVTAIGPLHPFNPSYTTTLKSPDATLNPKGLPLFHENDYCIDDNRENRKVDNA